MKLFKRKSARKIKSEIERINQEMSTLYTDPFMTKTNFDMWSDLNHKLFEMKNQLK